MVSFGIAGALRDGLADRDRARRDARRRRRAGRCSGRAGRWASSRRRAATMLAADERRRRPERAAPRLHERDRRGRGRHGERARWPAPAGCTGVLRAVSDTPERRSNGLADGAPTWAGRTTGLASSRAFARRAARLRPRGRRRDARARSPRGRDGGGGLRKPRPPRRPALVLRRRRPRDRDRRDPARAARTARLRPPPDRPQRPRGQTARAARRSASSTTRTPFPRARSACSRPTASRRRCGRTAERRGLVVVDAVCPLVSKVHAEARRYADSGHLVALVGHADHVEVIGTRGERPGLRPW